MIRNLKVLGLALVAVLAMGAVVASAASAQNGRITSTGPFFLDGTEEGSPTVTALTAFGAVVTCPGSTGFGVQVNSSNPILSGSEVVTGTATFVNCVFGASPVTVTVNGCDSVIHIGKTTGVADTYAVTSDTACPKEKDIEIDIYQNAEGHKANTLICKLTVKPQSGLTGATVKDLTDGTLTAGGRLEGMTVEKIKTGVLCPAETTKSAVLEGAGLIKGTSSSGAATALSISHL